MEPLTLVTSEQIQTQSHQGAAFAPDKLALLGGKGRNLALLTALPGVHVPSWCCIPSSVFDELREQMPLALRQRWQDLSAANAVKDGKIDAAAVDELAQLAAAWLSKVDLPSDIVSQLESWARGAGGETRRFAVRSSALGEDSGGHSFAGQFETQLFLSASELVDAVRHCYASAFGTRVLAYLLKSSLPPSHLRMALVIQDMWPSQKSGVLFTCNPKGRLEEMVAVAGYGLGEGIVSDRVECDEIILRRASPVSTTQPDLNDAKNLQIKVRNKTEQIIFDADRGTGTCVAPVPAELQDCPVLSREQIEKLTQAALVIEDAAGCPQDIEWGFDTSGTLAILQTRPITTIPAGNFYLCDNGNVSESYPGLSSPLTFDVVRSLYSTIFTAFIESTGTAVDTQKKQLIFDNLVIHVQGRIYYNLSNWYAMLRLVRGTGPFVAVWEEMLGFPPSHNQARSAADRATDFVKQMRTYACILKSYVTLDRRMASCHKRFRAISSEFSQTALETMSLQELVVLLHDTTAKICRGWEVTLWNDAFTFSLTALTRRALQAAGVTDAATIMTDLLSGDAFDDTIGMESAQAIASTTRLARLLANDHELLNAVRQQGMAALQEPSAKPFRLAFEAHIARFGDRTLNELKLETRTFRQKPQELLGLLLRYAEKPGQSQATHGNTERHDRAWAKVCAALQRTGEKRAAEDSLVPAPVVSPSKQPHEREEAESRVRKNGRREKSLATHLKALTLGPKAKGLRALVRAARKCMRHRENSRFDRSRAYGIARAITTEMGLRLCSEGVLKDPQDIYLLKRPEIEILARPSSHSAERTLTYQRLVEERKILVEQWKALSPAGRFWIRGLHVDDNFIPQDDAWSEDEQVLAKAPSREGDDALLGTGSSPGTVEAPAIVLDEPAVDCDVHGKILVTRMTDPGWVFLMVNCSGLVSEKGSILSHTAIIGRELGIPTVVGVAHATRRITSGARLMVDGTTGRVRVLKTDSEIHA